MISVYVKQENDEICPICIDPLKGKIKKYVTECHHTFHKKCFKNMCKNHKFCPLCRENIEVDCREIIGHKSNEMPANLINQILKREQYDKNNNIDKINNMRTKLLSMKFPPKTEFSKINFFADAFYFGPYGG